MKNGAFILAIMLLLGAFMPTAGSAPSFEGGKDEGIASLMMPDCETTIDIVFPADYYVARTTMNVAGMASVGNASAFPENVTVSLDEKMLWAFRGAGYGPLGMQDSFSTGQKACDFSFESGGGVQNASIKLPKNACVKNATMQLTGFPPADLNMSIMELANFTGFAGGDSLGNSVSDAGDVNGDGFDDVIAGSPYNTGGTRTGYACIYFGGPNMDNVADVVMTGTVANCAFGLSVSGAGDVNNDGYADVIVGEPQRGCVYVFLGGPNMDNRTDVILMGESNGDRFGYSVSDAGDVNNDGYGDVIVGAYNNLAANPHRPGRAYIFLGGQNMDNVTDIVLDGEAADDYFGYSVSGAGDLNHDGYDDIIVGAPYYIAPYAPAGRAYIYLGGGKMNNVSDVVFETSVFADNFGYSVSGAGDVNNDGYDDVIVGLPYDDFIGTDSGQAYIYFGGANMDAKVDLRLWGNSGEDLGYSVSAAGDINHDGCDDVVVGAPCMSGGGLYAGKINIYLGGPNMDNIADAVIYGPTVGDMLGYSVSSAGDVNNDGYDDLIAGTPYGYEGGNKTGYAYIYSNLSGIYEPYITIASGTIWNRSGYFRGNVTSGDFAGALNEYLRTSTNSTADEFENSMAEVTISVNAKNNGSLNISNLRIIYLYNATIPNFAANLDGILKEHQDDKDASGNIRVPIRICSQSAGRVRLSGLNLSRDLPPSSAKMIGPAELEEDTANETLIDLHLYFQDDFYPVEVLDFSMVSSTNLTFVALSIKDRRYLSADAMTGAANDNWTGTVEATVACSDRWGQRTESNKFTIIVKAVNDPPVITSMPATSAEPGVPYYYNVSAIDAENDTLQFSLTDAPADMTISSDTGGIRWIPTEMGGYKVEVTAADGEFWAKQSFFIDVPNRPPRITSTPPLNAGLEAPYVYNLTAEDPNRDALIFEIGTGPDGMRVNPITGEITWTPAATGDFSVSASAYDGKERDYQNFTINIVRGNRAPEFITVPVTNATVDMPYSYNASGTDVDGAVLTYSIESGPENMTMDAATGITSWTPAAAGKFSVILKVSDGKGGEARQEFAINVSEAIKPSVILSSPEAGKTLKGTVTFSGKAIKGTRDVARVKIRVDGKDWANATGTYNWTYKLDSKSLKNAMHTFEFRAFDGKEYSNVLKADFKVDNPSAGKRYIPMMDGWMMLSLIAAIGALMAVKWHGKTRPNNPLM